MASTLQDALSALPTGGPAGAAAPLADTIVPPSSGPTNTGPALPAATSTGPVNLSSYANQYPASVIAAAQQIFASDPNQASTFQGQYGGNLQSWLNSFTQWWSNYGSQVAGQMQNFAPEASLLSALGYQPGPGGNFVAGPNAIIQAPPLGSTAPGFAQVIPTTAEPTEQGIYDESIGGINNEVLNDQNLANETGALQGQNVQNFATLGGVLGSAIAPPGQLSQVTTQENAAASTAASAQITSLSNAVSSMQQSLTGTLAQQAAALQATLQQIQANISQFGSTESQALTTQINTQLNDLQTSIGQQKTALQTQIQQLSGAADTSSQAQLAALQTQLQQLTQAETPVAQARTQAAQAQATAVNIGEAQAKNQIRAQNQLQGFVGDSSMQDSALTQAGITAAQNAAADVGNANLTNAQEYQAINDTGANTEANIADTLAQQKQAITGQGATGEFNLATALATGQQGLEDTGASGQAAITAQTAGQAETAGNTGAEQQYSNTVQGLQAQNQLADTLAQGTNQIQSTEAQQVQADVNNNYSQSLSAALTNASLPSQEAGSIASTDNLQNAGLINAQNALNWWATPNNTPTPATTTTTASTAGNSIAQAGAGLLGAATSIGNSKNWWQTPSTAATSTAAPAAFTSDPNAFNIDTSLVGSGAAADAVVP